MESEEVKTGIDIRESGVNILTSESSNMLYEQFDREEGLYEYVDIENSEELDKFDMFSNFFKTVWILGLGGIGGHVAEMVSSLQSVENLVLFDDDIVETSNLNRTIYTYHHINSPKVLAASEIVSGRNIGTNVSPIVSRFDENFCNEIISTDPYNLTNHDYLDILVVDCRDDFYNDYHLFDKLEKLRYRLKFTIVRAAYDGMSITLDVNPKENFVWTKTASGYENAPSHSIPSRLAALLILTYSALFFNSDINGNKRRFRGPYTFNLFDLFNFIHTGVKKKNADMEKNKKEDKNEKTA